LFKSKFVFKFYRAASFPLQQEPTKLSERRAEKMFSDSFPLEFFSTLFKLFLLKKMLLSMIFLIVYDFHQEMCKILEKQTNKKNNLAVWMNLHQRLRRRMKQVCSTEATVGGGGGSK
jgi:hypothetical protein